MSISLSPRVLIVEDDPDLREAIIMTLDLNGIAHEAYSDAEAALAVIGPGSHSLLVSDFRLPGMTGLELLKQCRSIAPELPVVIMTAFADAKLAVEALKAGARDFLIKPFVPEQLVEITARYQSAGGGAATDNARGPSHEVIAVSAASRAVMARCERVASTDATVLLTGESGVGKDVFARRVHELSKRASKPYVAINCAAIPETLLESTLFGFEKGAFTGAAKAQVGKFEQADGGTLFLDEIGEMPIELQAKLLRVLQDRTIERIGSGKSMSTNIRIITATNRDLQDRVRAGQFREDLYYRLAVFPILIPSLRERVDDILPLAQSFIHRYSATMGRKGMTLSQAAKNALVANPWRGNVRELENAIQRALLLCDDHLIEPEHMELQHAPPIAAPVLDALAQGQPAQSLGQGDTAPSTQAPVPVAETALHSAPGPLAYAPIASEPAVSASSPLSTGPGTNPGTETASIPAPNTSDPSDIRGLERDHILKVLASVGGNRRQAVTLLGISERALRYKIKAYKEQGYEVA